MSLILAGIDEAGYGPLLGPLAVGLSVFRVPGEDPHAIPNLWTLLSTGVCREPGRGGKPDARGRVAIADSKLLKLANSVRTTHPLVHLERGVLAMLGHVPGSGSVISDSACLAALGAELPSHACYASGDTALPLTLTDAQLAIARNISGAALANAGVELADLRCSFVAEPVFNRVVRETGSKGEVTAGAVGAHLRRVWERFARPAQRVGVVCDRLGGRAQYADLLAREVPGASVETIEEGPQRSRYLLHGDDGRRVGVSFITEGESAHLPVALASMVAKFARELAMLRFNRYWCGAAVARGAELKPTAGYSQDGRRWLDDAAGLLAADDRDALVRIA